MLRRTTSITAALRMLTATWCAVNFQRSESHTAHLMAQDGQKKIQTKMLVVGGGIVGASLAYFAAQKLPDRSVVLLDRGFVGGEATGLSAGTIHSTGAIGPKASMLARLRSSTTRIYKAMEDAGLQCGYVQSGALVIANNTAEMAYLEEEFEKAKLSKNVNMKILKTNEEVVSVEPGLKGGTAIGALYTPESGYVEPMTATHAFLDAARDKVRIEIHEGAEVINISKGSETQGYFVQTKNGLSIQCDTLVLCTGAWTHQAGKFLGLDIPIYPVKGQIWVTEPVAEDHFQKVIFIAESGLAFSKGVIPALANVPRYCTHDRDQRRHVRHAYGRRLHDGRFIFGGDRIFCGDLESISHEELYGVNMNQVSMNQSHVYEFCPELKKYAVEGAWAGPMPFSQDGLPIVGSFEAFGHPNAWVVSGMGPHGVMESPAISKIVASAIVDKLSQKNQASDNEVGRKSLANLMFETFSPSRENCVRVLSVNGL